jgi:hypothetical protein
LYRACVEQLIAARGRANYREARAHVDRMRGLYARLGEREEGEAQIAALRAHFQNLPALQQEFTSASGGLTGEDADDDCDEAAGAARSAAPC